MSDELSPASRVKHRKTGREGYVGYPNRALQPKHDEVIVIWRGEDRVPEFVKKKDLVKIPLPFAEDPE